MPVAVGSLRVVTKRMHALPTSRRRGVVLTNAHQGAAVTRAVRFKAKHGCAHQLCLSSSTTALTVNRVRSRGVPIQTQRELPTDRNGGHRLGQTAITRHPQVQSSRAACGRGCDRCGAACVRSTGVVCSMLLWCCCTRMAEYGACAMLLRCQPYTQGCQDV